MAQGQKLRKKNAKEKKNTESVHDTPLRDDGGDLACLGRAFLIA